MAKITFDENSLTIGDLEDFEDAVGMTLDKALKEVPVRDENDEIVRDEKGRPETTIEMTARVLKALVWIASRQENPEFTLADARNVKVTELDVVRAGADASEVDPKD